MFDAPAYSGWLAHAALVDEYRHYALQLRVLSESRQAGAIWALKSPGHLGHLDALLAALPGCTVVVCHRHPHQAVASYASLVHTLRRAYSGTVSPHAVGRQALERTVTAVNRSLEVRAATPGAVVVDVSYGELVRDPVSVVRAVYERRGRSLGEAVAQGMLGWVAANPQHKHGRHRYGLADFGLTSAQVDAAFAPYMDAFGALAC